MKFNMRQYLLIRQHEQQAALTWERSQLGVVDQEQLADYVSGLLSDMRINYEGDIYSTGFAKELVAKVVPVADALRTPKPAAEAEGWFIPLDCMTGIAQDTFKKMISTIRHGGEVDVVARIDGKEYRWECDGLKYAKLQGSKPTPPEAPEPSPSAPAELRRDERQAGGEEL